MFLFFSYRFSFYFIQFLSFCALFCHSILWIYAFVILCEKKLFTRTDLESASARSGRYESQFKPAAATGQHAGHNTSRVAADFKQLSFHCGSPPWLLCNIKAVDSFGSCSDSPLKFNDTVLPALVSELPFFFHSLVFDVSLIVHSCVVALLDVQLSCLEAAPERLSMSDNPHNVGQHGRQQHCPVKPSVSNSRELWENSTHQF